MRTAAILFFLSTATCWAAAERTPALTTWEFSTNLEEQAAQSVSPAPPAKAAAVQRMDAGDREEMFYRGLRGGAGLPRIFSRGGDTTPSGLVKSAGTAVRKAGAETREATGEGGGELAVVAHDDAAQDVYMPDDVESWLGLNGGGGFGAWTRLDGNAGVAVEANFDDHNIGDNTGDFTLQVSGGEVRIGRELTAGALESGEFSVRTWAFPGSENAFTGFAVYDSDLQELLRWGVLNGEEFFGVVYRVGDGEYTPLQAGVDGVAAGWLDYTLTWSMLNGGLEFSLVAAYPSGTPFAQTTVSYTGAGGKSVATIAAVASSQTGESMAFDYWEVRSSAEVPEPGTLGLLAVGLAGLAGGRRMRRGE